MSRRLFEEHHHAKLYADKRPSYSQKVFDTIFDYCQYHGTRFNLAVDVGCGTGHQSTLPLISRFKKVIGVDVSEAQIDHAPKDVPNLEFVQSAAENLSFLDSGSVDLVVTATSPHWFDIPNFFKEVKRVLTPVGCIAVVVYSYVTLPETEGNKILQTFISSLSPFHSDRLVMVIDGYSTLQLPFSDCKEYHFDSRVEWTVDQLRGFLSSYSSWQERLKVIPNCPTLDNATRDFLKFYQKLTGEDDPKMKVTFPVTILLGRKPYPC